MIRSERSAPWLARWGDRQWRPLFAAIARLWVVEGARARACEGYFHYKERSMKFRAVLGLVVLAAAGCTVMNHSTQTRSSSSLVNFLYPDGSAPPAQNAVPELRVPLRVGLAFLPTQTASGFAQLDAAQKQELLERIRQRFADRKFVSEIVIIPDYYLAASRGFAGLEGVQRLYNVDLMALVSYDQVAHEDDNRWSLGYMTIVGAYVLKGTRHDVSTLVDLAVVDPATHSLVLRAGGFDTRHGTVTLVDENRRLRETATEAFAAATQQMIDHFDSALTAFESEVRDGKANVRVVSNHGKPAGGGGGLGAIDWLALLFLVPIAVVAAKRRD
jgi:rhombotail lipoprotein